MAAKQYRALEEVHLGMAPSVKPGEIVPAVFLDMQLAEHPVDFDRLIDLGAVQDASLPYGEDAPAGADAEADAPVDAPPAAKPRRSSKSSPPAE